MENYNSTITLNSKDNERYQAIYASQSYGTFYGIYGKFTVDDVYSDKESVPTSKLLKQIDLKLINYKGVLNICLEKDSKLDSETNFDDKNGLILTVKIKGATDSSANDTDHLTFDPPIPIEHDSYFVVIRELLNLHGQSGDEFNDDEILRPFVNGIFDTEFYERQGVAVRKKAEIGFPLEKEQNNPYSKLAAFYPGKICQTGFLRINTY